MPRRKRAALPCLAQTDFAAALGSPEHGENSAAVVHETGAAVGLFADYAPVYAVKLVRTGALALKDGPIISNPRHAAELLQAHLAGVDREHFVTLLLDAKNRVIGISTISIGDLSSALVHPREVFKPAILANAANILLAHNHPSGNPDPSPEDVAVTKRLGEAGDLLGIQVLDHVILGDRHWVSLHEKGLYYSSANLYAGKVSQTSGAVAAAPLP